MFTDEPLLTSHAEFAIGLFVSVTGGMTAALSGRLNATESD